MSFILDALKKSELERQRQNVPGLIDGSPVRVKQRLPIWAIALALLLGVNLLVLAVLLARGMLSTPKTETPRVSAAPRAEAPSTATAPRPAGSPSPTASKAFSPMESQAEYAPEIPVTSPEEATVEATRPRPAPPPAAPAARISAAISAAPARKRDPILTPESVAAADESEVLPTINELNLTGAQALPEIHLDVHVFATRATDRFIYVNMRKYREGQTLAEGPTVEQIRRDGVILRYQGLRFLLPRQ